MRDRGIERYHPTEHSAARYRRAHERWDREPIGHYERAGFGYRGGYRGAYAERPEFYESYGRLHAPHPDRSGWPDRPTTLPPDAEERHLRALADRDLARAVDYELYNVIGPEADRIAVYANNADITLDGVVSPRAAHWALDAASQIPGVHRVRNNLRVRRRR